MAAVSAVMTTAKGAKLRNLVPRVVIASLSVQASKRASVQATV